MIFSAAKVNLSYLFLILIDKAIAKRFAFLFTVNLKGTKAAIKQSGHAKKKATSNYLAPKEKHFLLNI